MDFDALLTKLWGASVYVLLCKYFMPYWNVEYTKALILHCDKCGR